MINSASAITHKPRLHQLRLNTVTLRRGYHTIIENLSLTLQAGTVLWLQGANGSGKSTLLRAMAGLLPPSSGTIEWQDSAGQWWPQAGDSRLPVGWLGEQHGLPPHPDHPDMFNTPMNTILSMGQKQRRALSLALQPTYDLILLDEPERGLDGQALVTLQRLLQERQSRNQCAVIASHHVAPPWATVYAL